MEEPVGTLTDFTTVRTHDKLRAADLLVKPKEKKRRKPGAYGIIVGTVKGHYGDAYWVQHDGDSQPAPYHYAEFELEPAIWRVSYFDDDHLFVKEFKSRDDALDFNDGVDGTLEGPVFKAAPEDGQHDLKTLFDHLTDD